ncbi:uncharacterized protein LOC130641645 isoform X2 [Hydractinia symbiolongicarpus]|uniref:uncharacterized protein LOC130641645 isoform X2 n=1 Tax=Hydractinia symbiolongicarpus TaxID=13093 RepID=UPI00254E026E|nr:uncharacterized protein LOC130641645 isoform X2 [Hydractinia symbiolongicarpus]
MKQKLSIFFVLLLSSILSTGLSNKSGYNKPLGRHRHSDGHIDIFDKVPVPQEFWDKCIHIQKPCLFRGAGSNFPAKKKWTNEYLIDRFGDLEVKYILGRKEVPANIQKIGRDTMKTFLESYTSEEKHIFSQLPDLMAEDIFVLPFLTCGSYKERLLHSNLWLSSGEKKSSLRYDAGNTIHCLLNGTKDWILIHPNFTEHIPTADYRQYSLLDVEKIDLKQYPKFAAVRYHHANMNAGDCMFLPRRYWHQVNSFGMQNLQVSVILPYLKSFNNSGCDGSMLHNLSLSKKKWIYFANVSQTLNKEDLFKLRDTFITYIGTYEKLDEATLQDIYHFDGSCHVPCVCIVKTLLRTFDTTNKGYIDLNDIQSSTLSQLQDALNAEKGNRVIPGECEYFMFSSQDIMNIIESLSESGIFYKRYFIARYEELGGSQIMGEKNFKMLNNEKDDVIIPSDIVRENAVRVTSLYQRKDISEKSTESKNSNIFEEPDDYLAHEPMYQPSETDDDYPAHEPMYQPSETDDDYPAHEPMYQPSEMENQYEIAIDDKLDVKDAPILSYIDDVEEILADAGHEEDLVRDEDMEDHEPIYQLSEEEEDNEKQAGLKEQSVQTNVEEIYHDVTSTLNVTTIINMIIISLWF